VIILDDVPTQFPAGKPYPVNGQANIAVISSFAPDEPLETIVTAALNLPNVHFYITGDCKRASKSLLAKTPANVTFTGFLPDSDYFGLLRSVDVVMVLTMRDHTNQRGACEAVWLGKPLITSDWPVLRRYFDKGTVHVDNSVESIQQGLLEIQMNLSDFQAGILVLQEERRRQWYERAEALLLFIQQNKSRAFRRDVIRNRGG